jgi:hypothetical protein
MKEKKVIMANQRDRLRQAGLVRVEVWVKPELREKIKSFDMRGEIKK